MAVDTLGSGLVQVTNTGEPSWTPETAWRLEEDLRLGEAVGGGPEQFSRIRSIASDSRGRIYVPDGAAQEIRVFQPDGTFSHTIGRRGEGPGEFMWASWLATGPNDDLVVLDDQLMRFSVFRPDGTFVESHSRNIVGTGPPRRGHLADGSYLDWAPHWPDGRDDPTSRVLFYPLRYSSDFQRVDTFPPIELLPDLIPDGGALLHFQSMPVISADSEGDVWFATSREYRLHRRTMDGDTVLVASLPAAGPPVDESDRESVRRQWERRPDILAEQLEGLPETRPIVYGIVPDDAGNVLVFVDVAGEPSGTVVDVFRRDGAYRGRMRLPTPVRLSAGMRTVHIRGDHLYVVTYDELDVPHVVRLRIIKGS
jgi:hypothetical protein